jgi:hypothetical protein
LLNFLALLLLLLLLSALQTSRCVSEDSIIDNTC